MKFLVLIFPLFFSQFTLAKSMAFDSSQGQVNFITKGWPNLINIKGEGEGVRGVLNQKKDQEFSGLLEFDLNSLKTGIDLRDQHMKENYLESNKESYSQATLKLDSVRIPKNLKGKTKFSGKMTLHGKTQDVSGTCKLKPSGEKSTDLVAKVSLKLSDFGISTPSYKGITVADKVDIEIKSKVQILD
jgi:polyisoprenoid-binding protein YceI